MKRQEITTIIEIAVCIILMATLLILMWGHEEANQTTGVIGNLATTMSFVLFVVFQRMQTIKAQKEEKSSSLDREFQTIFFSLLQNQLVIRNKVFGNIPIINDSKSVQEAYFQGLCFFSEAKKQLSLIYRVFNKEQPTECDEEEEDDMCQLQYISELYGITSEAIREYSEAQTSLEKAQIEYAHFLRRYDSITSYYRHLYKLLQYVRRAEEEYSSVDDYPQRTHTYFEQYAQLTQAQMSIDELTLLYYNCALFPKFRELIVHFNGLGALHRDL
ncbi:MAG: putative phage abortive infection protein [Mediterranea sp.]|nr:putative phage abortive infection protein [Mediterranea sp.]